LSAHPDAADPYHRRDADQLGEADARLDKRNGSAQMHSDDSMPSLIDLPGLVPDIHGNRQGVCRDSWMVGSSPAKTIKMKSSVCV
jgi:hypothetical protein